MKREFPIFFVYLERSIGVGEHELRRRLFLFASFVSRKSERRIDAAKPNEKRLFSIGNQRRTICQRILPEIFDVQRFFERRKISDAGKFNEKQFELSSTGAVAQRNSSAR